MIPGDDYFNRRVEEAVKVYVSRVARRYIPFLAGLGALVLIIVATPSVSPTGSSLAGGGSSIAVGGDSSSAGVAGRGGAGALGEGSGSVTGTGSTAPTGAGGTAGAVAASSSGGSSGAAQVSAGAASANLATGGIGSGGSTGATSYTGSFGGASAPTTVTVNCSRRQLSWSYNGPCLTTFSGSNGGATSAGVTATTINAIFRLATSGESAAIEAAAGGDNQVQSEVEKDMGVYINYFNTQFQLYGRKVVYKPFTGQGDWVEEYQGQDLAGAQADAATAKAMDGFIDLSPAATSSSPPYCADLAEEHIICAGGVAETNKFMEEYFPYALSPVATFDYLGNYWSSMACQRMVDLPAIFAGDVLFQHEDRKFAIVALEEPDYTPVVDLMQSRIDACGGPNTVAKVIEYPFDITQLENEDVNIVAQLKASGATTVICMCDTLSPTLLTNDAVSQDYFPEWMGINDGDGYGQQRASSEWSHALLTVGTQTTEAQTEAYKVFERADPGAQPAEASYWLEYTYYAALTAFSAIQAAGPDLTPNTFMNGLFSLPPSLPGATSDGIPWQPGKDVFALLDEAPIGWWNPNAKSPDNGVDGTTISCSGADGAWHPIQTYEPSAYGPAHTQLDCFGDT